MSFRLSTGLRVDTIGTTGFSGSLSGGRIDIFGGTIPTDADTTEGSGPLLLSITTDGNALGSGGGLTFTVGTDGSVTKPTSAVWKGTATASGTATWFRFYASDVTTGASTTASRMDGTVGTSSSDLIMTTTSITSGVDTGLDTAAFTLPATL